MCALMLYLTTPPRCASWFLYNCTSVCARAGVFESWLHPSRYRTQLCKDTAKCDRVVCFFAHSLEELRTPANSFVPPPEERLRVPEPMQVCRDNVRSLLLTYMA